MDIRTQAHLPALRDLLIYRRQELLATVHAAEQALSAGLPPAAGDQRARDDLGRVEAALARLHNGSYGDCVQCGQPIPLQRLLVQPQVERCAACQAAFDGASRKP